MASNWWSVARMPTTSVSSCQLTIDRSRLTSQQANEHKCWRIQSKRSEGIFSGRCSLAAWPLGRLVESTPSPSCGTAHRCIYYYVCATSTSVCIHLRRNYRSKFNSAADAATAAAFVTVARPQGGSRKCQRWKSSLTSNTTWLAI